MAIDAWVLETAGFTGRARVRNLARRILDDPSPPCSLDWLAARAALSVRAVSRLFVRETGMTPAKFVERARVQMACALIESGDLRLKAVAARCGFGHEERMRRAFHRVLGASPRVHSGCGTMRR